MGHANKKTLIRQVSEELDDQFRAGKGRKKHIDKQLPDGMAGRIYTDTTLATYKKHCCYFVRWAKVAHGCKTLKECKKYVPEWMETRRGLSAWTQKTEASALAKLYRCRAEDLGISTPPELRAWNSALGWCAHAVDDMADRLIFREMRNDVFGMNEDPKINA